MISRYLPNKACCWWLEQRFQVEDTSWANGRSSKFVYSQSDLFHRLTCWGYTCCEGLPRWLSGTESACQRRRCRFDPWVGKIPWRRKWLPTLVFFSGEFHGRRSLAGCSTWLQGVRHDWTMEHTHACCPCARVWASFPGAPLPWFSVSLHLSDFSFL